MKQPVKIELTTQSQWLARRANNHYSTLTGFYRVTGLPLYCILNITFYHPFKVAVDADDNNSKN